MLPDLFFANDQQRLGDVCQILLSVLPENLAVFDDLLKILNELRPVSVFELTNLLVNPAEKHGLLDYCVELRILGLIDDFVEHPALFFFPEPPRKLVR